MAEHTLRKRAVMGSISIGDLLHMFVHLLVSLIKLRSIFKTNYYRVRYVVSVMALKFPSGEGQLLNEDQVKTPTVGLESTTTRLRALRSAD